MRAGGLRFRVTIQRLPDPPTADAFGDPIETWSELATVWGNMEPVTAREFFSADVRIGELTTVIRTRYLAGVKPKMRALISGRTFQIEGVVNMRERNRELELLCFERV